MPAKPPACDRYTVADVQPTEGPGLLASVWRFRWISLLIVLLCLGGGAAVGFQAPSRPTGAATLGLRDPRGSDVFSGLGSSANLSRYTANRAAFAESEVVLRRAATQLGGDYTARRLSGLVSAEGRSDSDVMTISARGRDSQEAARVANAVSTAYQETTAEETQRAAKTAVQAIDTIRAEVQISMALPRNDRTPAQAQAVAAAASSTLTSLGLRAAEIETTAKLFGTGVSFLDPAVPGEASARGGLLRTLAIALLLGLLLATAVAWGLVALRGTRLAVRPAPAGDPL